MISGTISCPRTAHLFRPLAAQKSAASDGRPLSVFHRPYRILDQLGIESVLHRLHQRVTRNIGFHFLLTLLALLLSAVLVFLMHIAQGREESALNRAGQYCLDNLINKLYEPPKARSRK